MRPGRRASPRIPGALHPAAGLHPLAAPTEPAPPCAGASLATQLAVFSDLASQACAWIILEPGETSDEKEIKEFCCGQIAHYRIPRYVRFTTELPISFTGKKFKMRKAMTQ
jgi:acyl-CoA synthetase (AMP-forming)/AMP-acid ligase II